MTEFPTPDDPVEGPPSVEPGSLHDPVTEPPVSPTNPEEPSWRSEPDPAPDTTADQPTSAYEPDPAPDTTAEQPTSAYEPDPLAGAGTPPPPPGSSPSPPPGPHPAGPPPVRRLYRSNHDRKIGGVSAGIAEYFGIDPTIVRLATLALMISGIGILVYLAAWIIVPKRPEGQPYYQPAKPIASERTMTLAFGLAALALAFGIVTGSWEVLAIALIGGGIWLLSERAPATQFAGAPVVTAPMPGGVGQSAPSRFATTAAEYEASTYGTAPPAYTVVEPKERKPQRITWIVLSLLALLTAVGVAASTGDWWNVSATRFLGVAIIIIGIGVVVGQIRNGGARGLIPLGILCALALFPVSAVDGLIDDGIGDNVYRPATLIDVEDSYSHGIGRLTVDLSDVDFSGSNETIDIDLGIGELIVIVPTEAGGQAVLQAKAGEISHMLPQTNSFLFEDGVNIETGTVRLEGDDGSLDLNIKVGLGTAELRSEGN